VSWLEILKEGSHFGNLGVDELNIKKDVRCAGPRYGMDEVGTRAGYLDTVMDLRSTKSAEKFWTI
jgi:hypothetical protein